MGLKRWIAAAVVAAALCPARQPGAWAAKNVILIAGLKSHGSEGNDIHDYAWSVRLLKTMLESSSIYEQVNVATHFNGWPADPQALTSADTIVILSVGRDGYRYREAPHQATPARVQQVDSLVAKDCGLVAIRFSTFAPDALGEKAINWYGGYFDWQTDGRRESIIR